MTPPQSNREDAPTPTLHQVTPVSKYLSLALFIILPFLGGWIGFELAPTRTIEKVIVIEKIIETEEPAAIANTPSNPPTETTDPLWPTYSHADLGFAFSYPPDWGAPEVAFETNITQTGTSSYRLLFPALSPSSPGLTMLMGSRSLTTNPPGRGPSFGDILAKETNVQKICSEYEACVAFTNPNNIEILNFQDYPFGYDEKAEIYVVENLSNTFGPLIISDTRIEAYAEIPDLKATVKKIVDSINVI